MKIEVPLNIGIDAELKEATFKAELATAKEQHKRISSNLQYIESPVIRAETERILVTLKDLIDNSGTIIEDIAVLKQMAWN